jgi:hypothetical protein
MNRYACNKAIPFLRVSQETEKGNYLKCIRIGHLVSFQEYLKQETPRLFQEPNLLIRLFDSPRKQSSLLAYAKKCSFHSPFSAA